MIPTVDTVILEAGRAAAAASSADAAVSLFLSRGAVDATDRTVDTHNVPVLSGHVSFNRGINSAAGQGPYFDLK